MKTRFAEDPFILASTFPEADKIGRGAIYGVNRAEAMNKLPDEPAPSAEPVDYQVLGSQVFQQLRERPGAPDYRPSVQQAVAQVEHKQAS